MKRIYSFIAASLFTVTGAFAQADHLEHRNCATMEVLERHLQEDPAAAQRMQQIEDHTAQYLRSNQNKKRTGVITIPVVVHVVYNTAAQNISDAQVLSQIDVLNEDFRKLNADASQVPSVFQGVAADAQIEFCLAKRDPNGNATNGITRTQTSVTSFSSNDAIKYTAQGGKDAWNTSQYLNLWVGNLSNGLLGYAQFPGSGSAATDGVVVLFSACGRTGTLSSNFNKGRTATHEVGHWLNLRHIWGDANCGNDFVSDTPTQRTSNSGCPSFPKVTCSNGPNGDMWMNYMDYTYDRCMYMFTAGQSARMDAVLLAGGFRNSLLSSQGCVAPTGGTACTVPTGLNAGSITHTSATLNWNSTGAGSYSVQIKASSSSTWQTFSASTNSLSITGMAASTSYDFRVAGVCGSIQSDYSPAHTFMSTAVGGGGTAITVGSGTATVAQHPYGTYYMDERVQYIITKAELEAAGYSGGNLTSLAFYVTSASSQVMNGYTIKLSHTSATGFGNTSYLSNTGATTVYSGNHTAQANSWNTHNFSTPFAYNGSSNILVDICFNNASYTTNSSVQSTSLSTYMALYKQQDVSNGDICATTTGTRSASRPNMRFTVNTGAREDQQVTVGQAASLFPNPVSSGFTIRYVVEEEQANVSIQIFNAVGALVGTYEQKHLAAGLQEFHFSASQDEQLSQLPAGLYFCTLRSGNKTTTLRFVLQR